MHSRRQALKALASLSLLGLGGCKLSFEQGLRNPCKSGIPAELLQHPTVKAAFTGINPKLILDVHAHLFGDGDSGSGIALHPEMHAGENDLAHKAKRFFYLNAGCIKDVDGQRDQSMLARVNTLMNDWPEGARIMLFAFDWHHNKQGKTVPELSTFYVPNHYAAKVAASNPKRFAWAASVHPYRADALDALSEAKAMGAIAVKWLPASQGMDPQELICKPYFDQMVKLKLPLIIHCGEEQAVKAGEAQTYGNPLRLRLALERGVKVIVAHCASLGNDVDERGNLVTSFSLFAKLMDEPATRGLLYGDLSATTQVNRMAILPELITRTHWHERLLHGSDYPLPGVMPLFSVNRFCEMGLLSETDAKPIRRLREYNPLMFDFVLKRSLAWEGKRFAVKAFETALHF